MQDKTLEIPVLIQELQDTGLISDHTINALHAEKLELLERIRGVKRLCLESVIEPDEAQAKIQEMLDEYREKLRKLGLLDPDDASYID